MSELTESIEVAQPPLTAPSEARCPSLPSLPTVLWMRSSSNESRSLRSITSLSTSAIRPAAPVYSGVIRTVKSPLRNATSTFRSSRWSIRSFGRGESAVGIRRFPCDSGASVVEES